MEYRPFGRADWHVAEIGYGMWGIGGGERGWQGAQESNRMACLHMAVDLGCNFFDTAPVYGDGQSERLLGDLIKQRNERLFVSTKITPANRTWPSKRGDRFGEIFPADHMARSIEKSLLNLGVQTIDVLHFHVWEDEWAKDPLWQKTVARWKDEKIVNMVGISINRWETRNSITAIDTGLIDAVQVIYNIFDQDGEDQLFPLCREKNVAVIARVPFDEGSLTGSLLRENHWPKNDWRHSYFVDENLLPTLERVDRLRPLVPEGSDMATLALRFILANPDVCVTIPGMRTLKHVDANISVSGMAPLPETLRTALQLHRWDRTPTWWSQ